jgi:tRNA pseudouridine55 synthase
MHGVLVLDKPKGPTSARCLESIKHRLGQRKIGHAGTLDPMATGVLVVLLGEATKMAGFVTEGEKVYTGQLRLGRTTDTFDAEGTVTAEAPWEHLTPEVVREAALSWKDMSTQEIPPYSAVKVAGQPLYKKARKGEEVPVITKPVTVFDAEVLAMELPLINFRVRVSPGTYVRSLVHSLGTRLGCGAHLTELTRERSHPFGIEGAVQLDELLDYPERLAERLVPLASVLPHWPRLTLTTAQAKMVRDGKWLALSELPGPETRVMLADPDGQPVALAEPQDRDGARRWAILRGLNAA